MLAGDPGRVFTRSELLREVWGTYGPARALDTTASRVRRKLAHRRRRRASQECVGNRVSPRARRTDHGRDSVMTQAPGTETATTAQAIFAKIDRGAMNQRDRAAPPAAPRPRRRRAAFEQLAERTRPDREPAVLPAHQSRRNETARPADPANLGRHSPRWN